SRRDPPSRPPTPPDVCLSGPLARAPIVDPDQGPRFEIESLKSLNDKISSLLVAYRYGRQTHARVRELADVQGKAGSLGESLHRGAGDQDRVGGRELQQRQQVLDLGHALDLDVEA